MFTVKAGLATIKQNSVTNQVQKHLENKGSVSNRLEYAGKQYGNFVLTKMKTDAVCLGGIAASAAAAGGIAKSKTAQNILTKGYEALKNNATVKKAATNAANMIKDVAKNPGVKKVAGWITNLPKPAKAVFAAGTLLTGLAFERVRNKSIYNAGKIDQEYTDKAKLLKQLG